MSYQFGQQIPLDNSRVQSSSMLESLFNYGKVAAPVGSGMALPAVPGITGDTATLGGGGFGMAPLAGGFGQPGMDAGAVLAGINTSGYTPIPTADAGGMFGDFFTRKNLLGGTNADGSKDLGVLPVGLGALQGLGSLYMGMQQYGLAKKQLSESKRQFDMEYGANKTLTNSRMEDRQRARVASNPGAYQSVDSYMAKNGVK